MSSEVKPRICEVLGVEVGERFGVRGSIPAYIDENGIMRWDDDDVMNPIHICDIINRPEIITRQTRFTADEVATMRYITDKLHVVSIARNGNGGLFVSGSEFLDVGGERFSSAGPVTGLPHSLFPTIRPGRSVSIADIIKNKEEK